MFGDILSSIMDAVQSFLDRVIDLFPGSPFNAVAERISLDSGILGFLAWLVPFAEIIALLQAWTAAIFIYYIWMTVARWIKLIQ